MKNPWVIIGIITVVLFGGAIWLSSVSTNTSNEGVEILQHIKGNPEASVKLVEYSDFQCPACAAFQPVVAQLMEDYGDKISFEYKHFPLSTIHQNALSAAMAAEAAGQQGKFYEYHDLLFNNQTEWSSSAVPSTLFVKYAEELSLDVETFRKQMKSSVLRDKVRGEFDEGRTMNITGTPTFFLNGQKMSFETYQDFAEQIMFKVDPSLVPEDAEQSTQSQPEVKFGI